MARLKTIIGKEFVDILRDKRTIMTMIVMPLVAVPLLMTIVIRVTQRQEDKANAMTADVAFIGREYAPELYGMMEADSLFTVVEGIQQANLENLIREKALDGAVVVAPDFGERIAAGVRAPVEMYFRSSSSFNVTQGRIKDVIEAYDKTIVDERVVRMDLNPDLFDAIEVVPKDVSTMKEVLGKNVGGFLPYMFVIFMFTGAMYAGIDLSAGEKERGTLETLLSSPATRLEIVLGKFVVVCVVGIASALISMTGLYAAVRFGMKEIPAEIMAVVWEVLNFKVIAMVATLLIPLAMFFSALILALAIQAKSFREAQSTLTPLSIIVILPVVIGILPGMELNAVTALIPILNVSLATKDVIAGTIAPLHLILAYLSLLVLASGSIAFCVYWFNREETLFRS